MTTPSGDVRESLRADQMPVQPPRQPAAGPREPGPPVLPDDAPDEFGALRDAERRTRMMRRATGMVHRDDIAAAAAAAGSPLPPRPSAPPRPDGAPTGYRPRIERPADHPAAEPPAPTDEFTPAGVFGRGDASGPDGRRISDDDFRLAQPGAGATQPPVRDRFEPPAQWDEGDPDETAALVRPGDWNEAAILSKDLTPDDAPAGADPGDFRDLAYFAAAAGTADVAPLAGDPTAPPKAPPPPGRHSARSSADEVERRLREQLGEAAAAAEGWENDADAESWSDSAYDTERLSGFAGGRAQVPDAAGIDDVDDTQQMAPLTGDVNAVLADDLDGLNDTAREVQRSKLLSGSEPTAFSDTEVGDPTRPPFAPARASQQTPSLPKVAEPTGAPGPSSLSSRWPVPPAPTVTSSAVSGFPSAIYAASTPPSAERLRQAGAHASAIWPAQTTEPVTSGEEAVPASPHTSSRAPFAVASASSTTLPTGPDAVAAAPAGYSADEIAALKPDDPEASARALYGTPPPPPPLPPVSRPVLPPSRVEPAAGSPRPPARGAVEPLAARPGAAADTDDADPTGRSWGLIQADIDALGAAEPTPQGVRDADDADADDWSATAGTASWPPSDPGVPHPSESGIIRSPFADPSDSSRAVLGPEKLTARISRGEIRDRSKESAGSDADEAADGGDETLGSEQAGAEPAADAPVTAAEDAGPALPSTPALATAGAGPADDVAADPVADAAGAPVDGPRATREVVTETDRSTDPAAAAGVPGLGGIGAAAAGTIGAAAAGVIGAAVGGRVGYGSDDDAGGDDDEPRRPAPQAAPAAAIPDLDFSSDADPDRADPPAPVPDRPDATGVPDLPATGAHPPDPVAAALFDTEADGAAPTPLLGGETRAFFAPPVSTTTLHIPRTEAESEGIVVGRDGGTGSAPPPPTPVPGESAEYKPPEGSESGVDLTDLGGPPPGPVAIPSPSAAGPDAVSPIDPAPAGDGIAEVTPPVDPLPVSPVEPAVALPPSAGSPPPAPVGADSPGGIAGFGDAHTAVPRRSAATRSNLGDGAADPPAAPATPPAPPLLDLATPKTARHVLQFLNRLPSQARMRLLASLMLITELPDSITPPHDHSDGI
jgi:hypothetical protein